MEAGGLEYDEASQDAYKGEVIGNPYYDLSAARLQFLAELPITGPDGVVL